MRNLCQGLIVVMAAAFSTAVMGSQSLSPTLVIPDSAGDACVEPVDVIRRQHSRFLFEQRDATVHQGIRDGNYSLIGCVECHATRDSNGYPVPVNAAGQFCESCHMFTGVSMDCFDCHATTPDSPP